MYSKPITVEYVTEVRQPPREQQGLMFTKTLISGSLTQTPLWIHKLLKKQLQIHQGWRLTH